MSRDAWRTLVMTAIVAVLAFAVAVTDRRTVATTRASLVTGLDARSISAIELVRPGEPAIVLVLGATGARVTGPSPGAADPIAVRDLVSAITAARVDRWARGRSAWRSAGLDRPSLTVHVTDGRGTTTIVVGAEVAASGQRWLGLPPDRAALVPAWVGRALDRRLDELRVRRVISAATPTGIELHGAGVDLVLAGTALVRRGEGASVRLAPARRAALIAALEALVLIRFHDGPGDYPIGTLRVLGGAAPAELSWFGPCPGAPDAVHVEASIGVGCIARTAIDGLIAAGNDAAAPEAISPQPLDGTVALARLAIDDRVELVRHGAAWSLAIAGTERTADATMVEALAAALAMPATIRPLAAGSPPAETWRVTTADGEGQTWQVWRAPDRVAIRRGDEPVILELSPAARAAAATAGVDLRDHALLALDPLRVAAIRATGAAPAALTRGELIGEWIVDAPARATLAPDAAALPAFVAALRVDRWTDLATLSTVRRTLTFTSDPPPGAGLAPVDTLRIGARRADGGCWVAVDDTAAGSLPAAACARLLAPLARR